jgi:hypothetical protein
VTNTQLKVCNGKSYTVWILRDLRHQEKHFHQLTFGNPRVLRTQPDTASISVRWRHRRFRVGNITSWWSWWRQRCQQQFGRIDLQWMIDDAGWALFRQYLHTRVHHLFKTIPWFNTKFSVFICIAIWRVRDALNIFYIWRVAGVKAHSLTHIGYFYRTFSCEPCAGCIFMWLDGTKGVLNFNISKPTALNTTSQ